MQREQYEKTLVEGTDFSLPRKQFIEDSVETNAVHEISETTPIPADNKGYKLLQLMGWSGTGLGKHENGVHRALVWFTQGFLRVRHYAERYPVAGLLT